MLKLYKRTTDGIHYWEAWEDDVEVIIHWGTLGTTGDTQTVPLHRGEQADLVIERESEPHRAIGFDEIELKAGLYIEYQCDGWGSIEDLEKRHRVENLMNEFLGWTGNGRCDGGDIGSGTLSVTCFVVEPDIAAETTIAFLRKENLLDGSTIMTKQHYGNLDEEWKVHWPN